MGIRGGVTWPTLHSYNRLQTPRTATDRESCTCSVFDAAFAKSLWPLVSIVQSYNPNWTSVISILCIGLNSSTSSSSTVSNCSSRGSNIILVVVVASMTGKISSCYTKHSSNNAQEVKSDLAKAMSNTSNNFPALTGSSIHGIETPI